mmetsp:Transcript_813/g.3374  ORF Transcript_813/g.3374 Transcript_813/m.3374 type:complete len:266 (+) Transcript_813:168-965(+)
MSWKSVTNQSAPFATASRTCTPPYPTNTSAPPGARDSRSVAPSPTMPITEWPSVFLMCFTASALPPALLVNSSGLNDSYEPSVSENRRSFAKTFERGTSSASATGLIMCRNPPDTRYTVLPSRLKASNRSLIPGLSFGGLFFTNASTESRVGCITRRRFSSASRNDTFPPIAAAVIAATSSPFPRYAASSSMPSSTHTVLSTSKQNAVDLAIKSRTSAEGSLLDVAGIEGAATLMTTRPRLCARETRWWRAFKSRGATRADGCQV